MNIKVMAFCAVMSMTAGQAMAGGKLDLKEITAGAFSEKSLSEIEPLADGETYAQISSDGKRIESFSFKTGKQTGTIFDAETARGAKLDRVDGYIMSPDGKRMLIQTDTKKIYRRSFSATYYIYSIANNKLEPLSDGGPQQTPLWSPDGNQVAFVRDNNIYLIKLLYNNSESQVTTDGRKNQVINGIPDWVNEEEFSTPRAMVFTADSRQIVWVRYDETKVREHILPDGNAYKYPLAGDDNASLSLLSFDIKSHQTRTIQLPLDADGYIPRLAATADPAKVAVVTLNRHQDVLRIFMANPLSTVCQQVLEEKADKYVDEEAYTDLQITDKHILFSSERDGFRHLYLYGLNGRLERQLTSGQYDVSDVYGFDEVTGDVYYGSHANGPADERVYVTHANGKTECLTPRAGSNAAVFSANYRYFLNTFSNLDTPPVSTVNSSAGKELAVVVDNQELARKYASYEMGKKELFTLTTSDQVTLNGWMVKPAGFDPSRRYPVVMFQYGGPGFRQVRDAWHIGMGKQGAIIEQYLAQQGYVVVCVDGRGSGGRGADFKKCTYLKLGQLEARDQVETALWLGRQSWVDKDRIGIWGWSFGGFNTLMAMSEGRGVFRAGIAIAPPTSWRFYDTIYTERFMHTPKENPSGYDDSPLSRVSKLHGALLLCHGLSDDNVHYDNTAAYVEALVDADKDFTQLVYTNRDHSITGGNTRNHLFRQCVNFFNAHLK